MNQLSVADGFRFGCGFFIAGFVAWLAMVAIMLVVSVVFGAALGGLFEGLSALIVLPGIL